MRAFRCCLLGCSRIFSFSPGGASQGFTPGGRDLVAQCKKPNAMASAIRIYSGLVRPFRRIARALCDQHTTEQPSKLTRSTHFQGLVTRPSLSGSPAPRVLWYILNQFPTLFPLFVGVGKSPFSHTLKRYSKLLQYVGRLALRGTSRPSPRGLFLSMFVMWEGVNPGNESKTRIWGSDRPTLHISLSPCFSAPLSHARPPHGSYVIK